MDLQASVTCNGMQAGSGIATLVMVQHVMLRPEPGGSRNGQQYPSARRQPIAQCSQRLTILLDMFENIEQHDKIVAPSVETDCVRQPA